MLNIRKVCWLYIRKVCWLYKYDAGRLKQENNKKIEKYKNCIKKIQINQNVLILNKVQVS